ncbi:succinylglutamate desuccinylase/aspartoacylase domain-containing protein [Zobellia galactanivorans]|uniref:succinylglutamate desuccinylase/aspartoacylase domain-containing protein n=1 Tax=Zobellia galactanivorans (strain DSM 12802 / CCUG 47099 / CIP 106680 / NCIMB 13871 / Dsij) TaxID=63186 RepID=UPI001C073237|nr:succinylglutamate desuccinylase/aspartoacylase family protein [Zobellia galactanivorans]MBU3025233.1 succinylglutamate desuccinylase/aspartoacylase family protein [Zobellia galactanivorans]
MKELSRIIGEYSSGVPGPLLFVTAGIHGNEPSGIIALKKVFEELQRTRPEVKGTLVGVSGNKKALEQNVRFIDEDLNRTWSSENIENNINTSHEHSEMYEIIEVLNQYRSQDFEKCYFLDCHTTSSESLPYVSVQDVNDNNEWAHRFPTYIIKGVSDLIHGDIDHYLSRTGLTGFVFEAGQHQHETAVENQEGIIWLALHEALGLDLTLLSCYPQCVENFSKKNVPDQKTFEITYRHGLKDSDEFEMVAGFENFSPIKKGQLLAVQNGQEIRSEHNGYIFMPLYQSRGDDGFFIVEEV